MDAVIDKGVFIRIVLNGVNGEGAIIVGLDRHHAELLDRQAVGIDTPDRFRLWLLAERGGQRHRKFVRRDTGDGASLRRAVWQIDDQAIAFAERYFTIQHHHTILRGMDAPTVGLACQHGIRNADDPSWQRDIAVQPDGKADGTIFGVTQDRPAPTAVSLGAPRTANGGDFSLVNAVALHQFVIVSRFHRVGIMVGRIAPFHQRRGIAILVRTRRIGKFTTDDVGPRINEIHIARHIRVGKQLVVAPVGDATEDGGDIPQYGVGILLRLDIHVAQETLFFAPAPQTVINQLIAILRDAVQPPFVDLGGGNPVA